MSSIIGNLESITARMHAAKRRSGRCDEVRLVAVTKTVPVETILAAIEAGVAEIGENRVQEAEDKFDVIGRRVKWHLIGHLQDNKVKRAAELFDCIQSVDSLRLAQRLSSACAMMGRESLDIFLQVNVDSDPAKTGIDSAQVGQLVLAVSELPRLRLRGLMTIGRTFDSPEMARSTFRSLKRVADDIEHMDNSGVGTLELSMGMSQDFEQAIEEGSTLVRVGSAIFGHRQ